MKKLLLLLLITFASCTEECSIDSEKLNTLGAEAEIIREQLNNAPTEASRNIYQLQLDQKQKEMDAVAQACQ
jgi:hypothetical protein